MEAFETFSEYFRSQSKSTLSKTSVSIGINVPNVFEFSFNYNDHHYKKSASKSRHYSETVNPTLCTQFETGRVLNISYRNVCCRVVLAML